MRELLAIRLVKVLDILGWKIDGKFRRPHNALGAPSTGLRIRHGAVIAPAAGYLRSTNDGWNAGDSMIVLPVLDSASRF
jgi:hypothetical protein